MINKSKKYDLKSNRKSIYSALIWYQIHILFEQFSYLYKIFSDCTILFYTDCILHEMATRCKENKQTNKQTLCWNSYLFTPGLPGLLEIMAEKDRRTAPELAEMKTDFTLSESTRMNGRKDWNGYNHGNKDVGYNYNNG